MTSEFQLSRLEKYQLKNTKLSFRYQLKEKKFSIQQTTFAWQQATLKYLTDSEANVNFHQLLFTSL